MLFYRKTKILKQGKEKDLETSQEQILCESTYADPQAQALYNEQILSLGHKAALNA